MLVRLSFLVVICATLTSGLKILGLFPHAGKSHFDVFKPLLRALAERGHQLTVVSHFPQKANNYKNINLAETAPIYVEVMDLDNFQGYAYEPYITLFMLGTFARDSCEKGLSVPSVQELIHSNATFDLILMEYFNTDCFAAFAHKFQVPIVGISSCAIMPWTNDRYGNPDNPSYIPNILHRFSDKISFLGRVENTILYVYSKVMYTILIDMPGNTIARKYFGEDLPSLESIVYNYSRLLLVNTHFSLNLPRPYTPGIVQVSGINIGTPKKLPQNIEKWINESTHGVIYFSLGSMIKGHTFPEEKRRIFLQVFARLPQRVLWKWENDTMPGKPDNVMIQKWMPQFDILCHPNVKAFISHGGLLGTTEAVHCGVPAIVMPQFGDQYTNAKAWEANNAAVILKLREVNEDNLQEALQKVLDPKFKLQANELSERYRDRPMPPLETAIYWVEYVARHKGAAHLRTAAVGMPFYKYLLLDVVAFLFAVFAVMAYVNFWVWRWIFRKVFGKKSKEKTN